MNRKQRKLRAIRDKNALRQIHGWVVRNEPFLIEKIWIDKEGALKFLPEKNINR